MFIRPMRSTDTAFAFSLTQTEGWLTETEQTFRMFLESPAALPFVAEAQGQPAGVCVGVGYQSFGFIGELIVATDQRGRGLGRALFHHTLRALEETGLTSIMLLGDEGAVPIYEKAGFSRRDRILNMVGYCPEGLPMPPVQPMSPADLTQVLSMDRQIFGGDRSFLIHGIFASTPEYCFVCRDGAGHMRGFICGRQGNGLVVAGPWVVSPSCPHPELLLSALIGQAAPQRLRLDVPESQRHSLELLGHHFPFLHPRAHSWRMLRGPLMPWGLPELELAAGTPATG